MAVNPRLQQQMMANSPYFAVPNAAQGAQNAGNLHASRLGALQNLGGKAKMAAGVGVGVLGTLALTRTLGSGILDASTDEYDELNVRSNPVGGFIFGSPDQSPEGVALRNMRMSREMGLAEQERLTKAYQDNAKFNQELALKNAMERAPLEYGWGSANTYQATNADLLANSVNNYLSAMGRSNQAMQMILGRGNSLLGGQ